MSARTLLPHRAWLATAAAVAGCAPAVPPLQFAHHGGDAWTFELPVTGDMRSGACESVEVVTPLANVDAVELQQHFAAEAPLQEGTNSIHAVCRKAGRIVARSPTQRWQVPLRDAPKAWIRTTIQSGHVRLDPGRSELATARAAPLIEYRWHGRASNPAPLRLADGRPLDGVSTRVDQTLELATPTSVGDYHIELVVRDALGRSDRGSAVFRVAESEPHLIDLHDEHPPWVDRLVLYGAAPFNFDPQNFSGIRERLDEVAALGATAVWLSPVNASGPDDFGYAVTDHFALRASFGNEMQFRALIDRAHELGLRVLIDFVPNHVAEQHRYHEDVLAHGRRSPYYDWFDRDASGSITQYFDWSHLKNLNFDNAQVRNYITAALARFVREFDIDGFRVDASWAVARRAPEFWPQVRAELKRIDPDIFLLAEASAREPYHVENGFDAAYDWTDQLGRWAWEDVFAKHGEVDVGALRAALTNHGRGLPPDSLVLRFLNNNDTGARFASRHGRELASLAATLLFTLPGLPLVYNGDEMAAEFEPYDEGPPLAWKDSDPMVKHYRTLIRLRAEQPALRSRDMALVATDREQEVLAFVRPGSAAGPDLLVLLNFTRERQRVQLTDVGLALRLRAARDLLDRSDDRNSHLELPAWSARILELDRQVSPTPVAATSRPQRVSARGPSAPARAAVAVPPDRNAQRRPL